MVQFSFPYVLPLFLGMTFDAQNYKPGVDIYGLDAVKDYDVVPHNDISITYKVTKSKSESTDAMGISADIALKLNTIGMDIAGKGSYLKNENDYRESVEILTTLKYMSKTHSLRSSYDPLPEWWKKYTTEVLGTHYVFSITYGIEMIASARFIATNHSELEDIRVKIQGALGKEGNKDALEGNMDKLAKELQGKVRLEISFFGTGPVNAVVNTLDGFLDLVGNFKKKIDDEGMTEGFPMSVELLPLTDLAPASQREKFNFEKNPELENKLSTFNDYMDDLRLARSALTSWTRTLPNDLKPEYEAEIGRLLQNITDVMNVFYSTSSNLDLTKDVSQLEPAMDAYNYDGLPSYYRFSYSVTTLKQDLDPKIERGKIASDTYIQWGKSLCSEEESILLYDGFAFSSAEEGIGGSAKYGCAPKPRATDVGYELKNLEMKSTIAGVRYAQMEKTSNPFKGGAARKISEFGVTCSKCYAPKYGSISMFPATSECPSDWKQMYLGFLMSSRIREGHTTEYICVDEHPSLPFKMEKQAYSKNTIALTVVRSSGALPLDIYTEGDLIRCAVCAVRKKGEMY